MFQFLRRKTKSEKLQERHQLLLKEAYELSKTSRVKSDHKAAEAEEILKEIQLLENAEN